MIQPLHANSTLSHSVVLLDGRASMPEQPYNEWCRILHQCIYDLCLGGKGFNCVGLYAGGGFIFDPLKRIDQSKGANDEDQSIIDDNNREPPLPPPFDLVIFGGTGAFRNVSGKAELMTIAGRNRRGLGVIVQNLMTYTNIPLPVDGGGGGGVGA
ncbi:hypothetical protein FRACYDRAFT_243702 [Fragilariopsis cylindrus CCMP1102]|uniref:Uncharacterized protein n=1 Tax=Fragilariopsis cylindrus CCMP1102 TaxID=635003 RepID=A0A1E7F2Q3_9STRA|nr:hypothetical protein FRACYDRAFT_243702 [Fragilariopsis cylindrus CCMP1102]|eukprot:OEU12450.1 hypothetical protein FRACYDRAFT_243702 [Fragilariopsis cylindrus CCMP1102]